jgi:hypothetical protein
VSVDLAVWEGPRPASDTKAAGTFVDLCERYLDGPQTSPSQRIADYVSAVLARYPDLTDEGDDEVPWGSGPLLGNASGPFLYIDMKLNDVFEEAWRFCVETAGAHGLVAFDPQTSTLANPNPNAPVESVPGDGPRVGPMYLWVARNSWRWPFLRPLLPLLRRFL